MTPPFGLCVTALILALVAITLAGVFWPVRTVDSGRCRAPQAAAQRGPLTVSQARMLAAKHSRCPVTCPDRARARSRLAAAAHIAKNLDPSR
jgi:hypothetical protein